MLFALATAATAGFGASQRDPTLRDGLRPELDRPLVRAHVPDEVVACEAVSPREAWVLEELSLAPGILRERSVAKALDAVVVQCTPGRRSGSLVFELTVDAQGVVTHASFEPRTAELAGLASCLDSARMPPVTPGRTALTARGVLRVTPPPPRAGVGGGASVVSGELPGINRVVAGARGRIRGCYHTGLNADPGMEGRIRFDLHVTPSGTVSKASLEPSGSLSSVVVSCVQGVLRGLSFEAGQEPATVVGAFVFQNASR